MMYFLGKLISILLPKQAEVGSSSTRLIAYALIGFVIVMIIFYSLGAFEGI